MSGLTTPGKLPYPEGSDLVRDGDNAIRALAEAAQNAILNFSRLVQDSVPASTWGSLCGGTGEMPAGLYFVFASCLWYPEIATGQAGYTWLHANMNGNTVAKLGPYAGVRRDDAPNSTVLTGVLSFGGGTMSLQTQFGFANAGVAGCIGSSITAIRMGPV